MDVSNSGVSIELAVESYLQGRSAEWGTFTNVELLGYSEDGREVCKKRVGTIEPDIESLLTIECDIIPAILTFRADQSPCDEDTYIGIAVYESSPDAENGWDVDNQRECGEGLPPNVSYDDPPTHGRATTTSAWNLSNATASSRRRE